MFLAKFLAVLLMCCAVALARPFDAFNSDDDRINEISEEFNHSHKLILPNVERIFSSAEVQITAKLAEKPSNKIKRHEEDSSKSSKHAHSMITSMLSFVSSVFSLGKTIMRNE